MGANCGKATTTGSLSLHTDVLFKHAKFDAPSDVRTVLIPPDHAACIVKVGETSAKIDLPPGEHVLHGESFDSYDVPFSICVLPNHVAAIVSRSNCITTEPRHH